MLSDLRQATRALRRAPGFTIAAVLCLALGIGANSAIYSAVSAVLLHPVATPRLDRLVVVGTDFQKLGMRDEIVSPPEVMDLVARRDLFASGAARTARSYTTDGSAGPERVTTAVTLGDYWGVFAVRPALGRLYDTTASTGGRHHVVVLSHAYWQERYGADRGVIGRLLELNDVSYEIVGVLPAEFRYPRGAQLFAPYAVDSTMAQLRNSQFFTPVFRLRDGVTLDRVRLGLAQQEQRWRTEYPDAGYAKNGHTPYVAPLASVIAGQLRPILFVLVGAVSLVLLVACVNVASLQLVRATGRGRETAVHAALGANRARLARRLLAENVVLAAAGGVLGVGIGTVVARILARIAPASQSVLQDIQVDDVALAATAGVALLAAIVSGLVPALRAARPDLQVVLKEGSRGSAGPGARHGTLRAAVVAQVALSLVLLLGAGLLVRTLGRLLSSDPGFRTEQVVTAMVNLPPARYKGAPKILSFYGEVLARLRSTPGVTSAGIVAGLPLSREGGTSSPYAVVGREDRDPDRRPHANMLAANSDYFRAMGITLVRGAGFPTPDGATVAIDGPKAIVVDESLVKASFPTEDPIGRRLSQGMEGVIVGVVRSVNRERLGDDRHPSIYYDYRQYWWSPVYTIVVRSTLSDAAAMNAIRTATREIDPTVPLHDVRPMADLVRESVAPQRFAMVVLGGFATLSLVLAMLGIYGVLSYVVAQRRRELGVRFALGARPGDVARMVVRGGLRLTLVGLGIGTVAFLVIGRALSSLLYGVSAHDPLTLVGGATILGAVAVVAAYLPARRAVRVDPAVTLRSE